MDGDRASTEILDASPGARKGVGYALLAVVTVGSLILPVSTWWSEGGALSWRLVVEVALPLIVAVGLVALGVEVYRRDSAAAPFRMGLWTAAGWLFFAVIALFILTYQARQTGRLAHPWLVANNTALGGALVGGLVGWYDAERRSKQAQAERLGRRFAFLNRLLRHDVRNDASVIVGNAELMQEEMPEDERLAYILQSAEHIVELTHLSRIFEAMSEGEPLSTCRLGPILERAVHHAGSNFPHARIEPRLEPLEDVQVLADDLLASVFENLIRNAIQHNDRDEPTVWIRGRVEGDRAAVIVEDDGAGIPDEIKEELFEEGTKGGASTGTGLGLYLVKTLIDRYGGSLEVQDRDTRGTRVTVWLRLPGRDPPRPESA